MEFVCTEKVPDDSIVKCSRIFQIKNCTAEVHCIFLLLGPKAMTAPVTSLMLHIYTLFASALRSWDDDIQDNKQMSFSIGAIVSIASVSVSCQVNPMNTKYKKMIN